MASSRSPIRPPWTRPDRPQPCPRGSTASPGPPPPTQTRPSSAVSCGRRTGEHRALGAPQCTAQGVPGCTQCSGEKRDSFQMLSAPSLESSRDGEQRAARTTRREACGHQLQPLRAVGDCSCSVCFFRCVLDGSKADYRIFQTAFCAWSMDSRPNSRSKKVLLRRSAPIA